MKIEVLPTGMFQSNTYIVIEGNEAIVIDCGVEASEIIEKVTKYNAKIKYVLLTHGHIDHICSIDKLRKEFDFSVGIHNMDKEALIDANINLSANFAFPTVFKEAEILLNDGQTLELAGVKVEILHTPGHSKGGICIKILDNLFTGDTLFRSSVGRTDFDGGSHETLIKSIREKLLTLPEETVVYPGHGPSSTIGREKRNNGFLI